MSNPLLQILVASVFAGVISIDLAAFGQFQLSRPVVAASLLSLLLGCPAEGVVVGLIFELLFLDSLPVGSFIPDQALFPALTAVVIVGVGQAPGVLPVAVIVAIPSLAASRWADTQWRRSNERIYNKAEIYLRLGRSDLAEMQHRFAVLRAGFFHFLAFLFSCSILVPVCGIVVKGIPGSPAFLTVAAAVPFLTGLAALSADRVRRRGWIGFAVGLSFGVLTGLV